MEWSHNTYYGTCLPLPFPYVLVDTPAVEVVASETDPESAADRVFAVHRFGLVCLRCSERKLLGNFVPANVEPVRAGPWVHRDTVLEGRVIIDDVRVWRK